MHMHFPEGTRPELDPKASRVHWEDAKLDIEKCIASETRGLPKKIAIVGKHKWLIKLAVANVESVCFRKIATRDKD
jgi:hypothetical protein